MKKSLIALVAAAALATPAAARTPASQYDIAMNNGNGIIAILIGQLLPADQKVRG